MTPPAWPHARRNFTLWTVETAAWVFATAFIDSTTVLPVLMLGLSDSPFLASLIISIRYGGQTLPQLLAAALVSGRPTRKDFYVRATLPGRLALLWPAILMLQGAPAGAVVPAILLAYLAFWTSEGLSIVPWTDMLGKTVPPTRRGRLFALMHVIGGILGIAAGVSIRALLHHPNLPFPRGYGVMFLLAVGGLLLSTLALALLREPPSPPGEARYSAWALVRDIPNLLRGSAQFRLLVLVQALFGFAVMPAPLYILYAAGLLAGARPGGAVEAPGVGVFLAIQTAGMIVGNALLGHIGDHYGNRLLLRALALLHALVPLLATLSGTIIALVEVPAWAVYALFAPTFFGYGALLGSTWMGVTNYLLEIAPEHDRPAYIAVANALTLPAIILPMLGGLLLPLVGYHPLFLAAALVLLLTFFLTKRLPEPRK